MEILVVDDNKDICMLIESILISEGYNAQSCSNPQEFYTIIEKVKARLIITDMLMAGFDGRTLIQELKANPATHHVKIMLMSAHPDAPLINRTIGADDFLTKPFEIDDLVNKVQQLLKT